jgi:serine/threonine protein kinase
MIRVPVAGLKGDLQTSHGDSDSECSGDTTRERRDTPPASYNGCDPRDRTAADELDCSDEGRAAFSTDMGIGLGRYEAQAFIGSGSTGDVYRAHDTHLGRTVAVRVLAASIASDASCLARFLNDARAIGFVSHPNIAAVYDVGTADGRPFVVSELLEGETLRARMRGGPLPVSVAVQYALDIAHGLIAAHHLGVVHRDLKPENVFVMAGGDLKILDFGLSRCGHDALDRGAANPAAHGAIRATAGYMSPEQVRGGTADEHSDIFSLGVMLYEMIAGAAPFRGETAIETRSAIMTRDAPALPADLDVPPDVEHAINRCLEKEPEARVQSARDLAFVLDTSRRTTPAPPPPATARRIFASVLRLF